jgi:hypothetical protein
MLADVLKPVEPVSNVLTNVNAPGIRAEMHRNLHTRELRGG